MDQKPDPELGVEVRGNTALITIDNPPANTWDEESLGARDARRRVHGRQVYLRDRRHRSGEKFSPPAPI